MMRGGKISRFSHNTIVCEGTALPPRMKNKFLAADPLHQYLVLSDRIERGSTFETKDLGFPLKSKDFRFRPAYLPMHLTALSMWRTSTNIILRMDNTIRVRLIQTQVEFID